MFLPPRDGHPYRRRTTQGNKTLKRNVPKLRQSCRAESPNQTNTVLLLTRQRETAMSACVKRKADATNDEENTKRNKVRTTTPVPVCCCFRCTSALDAHSFHLLLCVAFTSLCPTRMKSGVVGAGARGLSTRPEKFNFASFSKHLATWTNLDTAHLRLGSPAQNQSSGNCNTKSRMDWRE